VTPPIEDFLATVLLHTDHASNLSRSLTSDAFRPSSVFADGTKPPHKTSSQSWKNMPRKSLPATETEMGWAWNVNANQQATTTIFCGELTSGHQAVGGKKKHWISSKLHQKLRFSSFLDWRINFWASTNPIASFLLLRISNYSIKGMCPRKQSKTLFSICLRFFSSTFGLRTESRVCQQIVTSWTQQTIRLKKREEMPFAPSSPSSADYKEINFLIMFFVFRALDLLLSLRGIILPPFAFITLRWFWLNISTLEQQDTTRRRSWICSQSVFARKSVYNCTGRIPRTILGWLIERLLEVSRSIWC